MIAGQRKAHKFIWLGLSVLMGILLVVAVKDMQFSSSSVKAKTEIPFKAELRENNTVFIRLNEPLKIPSALVYEIRSNKELGAVLGKLSGKGAYTFSLSKNAIGIAVFDNIKNQKMYTTLF